MRRTLLVVVLVVLGAGLVFLLVNGTFRGRGSQPAVAPVADATPKPVLDRAVASEPYPFKRVVVIAVGINAYDKLRGAADLRYAEADATEFADVCEKLYGFEAVRLLGKQATKRDIELTLQAYGRELGNEDALVVYFAGHGQVIPLPNGEEAGYLIPYDADLDLRNTGNPAPWASQALDMQSLADQLDGMNARHVVFFADACCSGFMTRRGSLERADLKTFLFGDKSRTIVAATTRRQAAREDATARHGYFTAALLEELKKDDAASVLDLYVPVMKSVAAKTNGAMTPQFAQVGDGDGMFVFIPKSIPRSQIEADLNGLTLEDAPARGLAGVQARALERIRGRTTFAQVAEAMEAQDYRYSSTPEELRKQWEAKFSRYQLNASLGDAWAMAALSVCYAKGLGTEKNPPLAYFWARQIDRNRDAAGVGRFFLAECYRQGIGVPKEELTARKYYQESAARGFVPGEVIQAEIALQKSSITAEEVAVAVKTLERGRERKFAPAIFLLAGLYVHDDKYPGQKADFAKARNLYEEAADLGETRAMVALYEGLCEDHPGVPKDVQQAEHYLRQAADAGYPAAQYQLALEDYPPKSGGKLQLKTDYSQAFRWAKLAAEQDHAGGQVMLARMYLDGNGAAANVDEAKAWCEKAAKQNYPDAFFLQGSWYGSGKVYGIKDDQKAIEYYTRAADLDHPQSCAIVAQLLDFEGRKYAERSPYWLKILHYNAKAAKLGAIDTKTATQRLLYAYLSYVNPWDDQTVRGRWKLFWETHPDTAAVATKILKENTRRLDWFDPNSVKQPKP